MTTSDIHSLSGAYALDAVDDLERAAFERHLRECEACELEVRELRETVSRLSDTVATPPPPALRASVLDAVARTPQARPGGRPDRGQVAAVTRWRRFAAVSVAAGVVAAGAGIGTWAVADRNVDEARHATAVAEARSAELERVLGAPDVRLVTVAPPGGGSVTVAVARSLNSGVAVLNGLPGLDANLVYQLWMIPEGEAAQVAVSAGVMGVGETAGATLLRVGEAVRFGLTVEPRGGSERPTLERLVTLVELPT